MKILHINSFLECGGAETVMRNTVEGLLRFAPEIEHCFAYAAQKSAAQSWRSFPCCLLRSVEGGGLSYFYDHVNKRRLDRFIDEQKPDVIHLHNFLALSPSVLLSIKRARRLYKTRVIHTVHGFDLSCPNSVAFDFRKKKTCLTCAGKRTKIEIVFNGCDRRSKLHSFLKGIRSFIIHNLFSYKKIADAYIAPCDFLTESIEQERIPKEKLHVVRNLIQDFSVPEISPEARSNGFVFFGRIAPEKNVPLLVKAFAKVLQDSPLPDLRLMIIGDGEEAHTCRELCSQLALGSHVEFFPFMKQEELFGKIARAKIMVLPSSFFETFGLSVAEAVLLGLVPVVSGHGALRETVELLGCGVLFEPENATDLAAQMTAALRQYETAGPGLRLAQQKVKELFSMENYIGELIKIIQKIRAADNLQSPDTLS